MKCPHCEYIDGYDDDNVCHDGDHGNYWYPETKMRRDVDRDYYDDGKREAYMVGCPSCKKCFIHEL